MPKSILFSLVFNEMIAKDFYVHSVEMVKPGVMLMRFNKPTSLIAEYIVDDRDIILYKVGEKDFDVPMPFVFDNMERVFMATLEKYNEINREKEENPFKTITGDEVFDLLNAASNERNHMRCSVIELDEDDTFTFQFPREIEGDMEVPLFLEFNPNKTLKGGMRFRGGQYDTIFGKSFKHYFATPQAVFPFGGCDEIIAIIEDWYMNTIE